MGPRLKVLPNHPREMPHDDLQMEFDIPVRMRDGVMLSTDVYRPKDKAEHPTILIRTPYNNNSDDSVRFGRTFASWGYSVVIQDVRGRNDSEGEFQPFTNEGPDGLDTVKWLRERQWFDGKFGMTGGSYLAQVQWDMALQQPPELKAMISMVSPSDMFINCWYRNGSLTWGDLLRWMTQTDARVGQNLLAYDLPKLRKFTPLKDVDKALGRDIWFWNKTLEHQTYDSFWKQRTIHDGYHTIDVPVLHITGWYDDCADGNMQHYLRMRTTGKTPSARKNQALVVGPWPHGINVTSRYGGIDFGQEALIDMYDVQKRWMDYWLKGVDNGVMKEKPVTFFTMGENRWREELEWPLKRAKPTKVFLHSRGRANGLQGDGRLSLRAPVAGEGGKPDEFEYDPSDPNPSPINVNEPDDRRSAERRDDALNYDSDRLASAVDVTGHISLTLFASTSARDTDFVGRLVDVYPNGYAHPVADGIITCKFRDSLEHPTLITPGEVYELTVDLWWTSNKFQKGHKIRVEVTSADFPRYAPNMNTGHRYGEDRRGTVAHQKIFHDSKRQSHILLPVIGNIRL
jgi:uncharacterized protein